MERSHSAHHFIKIPYHILFALEYKQETDPINLLHTSGVISSQDFLINFFNNSSLYSSIAIYNSLFFESFYFEINYFEFGKKPFCFSKNNFEIKKPFCI